MSILRRPKPRSLRRTLVMAVVNPVLILGGFGVGLILAPQPGTTVPPDTLHPSESTLAPAEKAAAELVVKHDCWTGEAPADVEFPGHVVVIVTSEAGIDRAVYSKKLVGPALDSLFGDRQVPFTTIAFCR